MEVFYELYINFHSFIHERNQQSNKQTNKKEEKNKQRKKQHMVLNVETKKKRLSFSTDISKIQPNIAGEGK